MSTRKKNAERVEEILEEAAALPVEDLSEEEVAEIAEGAEEEAPSLTVFVIRDMLTGLYLRENTEIEHEGDEPFVLGPFETAYPFRNEEEVTDILEIMVELWKTKYKASQLYIGRTPPRPRHYAYFGLSIFEPSQEEFAADQEAA